ncbi:MAG: four helix bundle protein [Candidatus Omnitrophota bacterium]|jgi:four helix bundle protein
MEHTFKNIQVWEKSHNLVLHIYRITAQFPYSEKYGLTSQIRRSSASIPTNIVEGYKRKSVKEFSHFLNIAESSLEETKYHLLLACDLKYLDAKSYDDLVMLADEIGRMIFGFKKTLKAYNL